jgi:hypothetical protein
LFAVALLFSVLVAEPNAFLDLWDGIVSVLGARFPIPR